MGWTERFTAATAAVRRHGAKAAVVLVVAAAAGAGALRWLVGPSVTVEPVMQRDLVQTVVASGRVEAPHRVDVGVQITGTVLRVPVDEGQTVAAGARLIELESSELRAAVSQADLAVQQAQAHLRQVREVQAPVAEQALRQARVNHDVALRTLERNRDLFGKEFIGQAALEDSERQEQVALAQLRTAEQQLISARPGGSDAVAAEAALAQAQAAAQQARARLSYAVVAAPVAGTLIARSVEPGDVVQPGKALMELSPAGETQLVVDIDEKNLSLLRLGQPALASADAYPEQRFEAQLVYINPGVDATRGSVEVKLAVASPPDYLKQDMTVSVDIEVARRPHAVLVANDALQEVDSPAPWVWKVDGRRARRQAVKLGLRSAGHSEVVQGLRPGERVVPVAAAAAAHLRDGSPLRAVDQAGS